MIMEEWCIPNRWLIVVTTQKDVQCLNEMEMHAV
jgi:hypothetical protein